MSRDRSLQWFCQDDRVLTREELTASLSRHFSPNGELQMVNESRVFWRSLSLEKNRIARAASKREGIITN